MAHVTKTTKNFAVSRRSRTATKTVAAPQIDHGRSGLYQAGRFVY
jgi:hypothetical protein